MRKHLVYLADIHGKDVKIEKDVLRDIAVLRRDKRTAGVGDFHRIIRNGRDADAMGVRHTRIGGALSRKASCVGFNVIAYDPFISAADFARKKAKRMRSLRDLLGSADIISLNIPLTKEGRHPTLGMFGKKEFGLMRKDAYIINVCRAEVMDTPALISALRTHKLGGIAVDVIEGEPRQNSYLRSGSNPVFDTFRKMPNVLMTPHSAFTSTRSVRDVKRKGAAEIRSVLEGEFPREIAWINPEVEKSYLLRFRVTRS